MCSIMQPLEVSLDGANSSTIGRYLQKQHNEACLGSTISMRSQGLPWAASCEAGGGPSCGAEGAARRMGRGGHACAACLPDLQRHMQ